MTLVYACVTAFVADIVNIIVLLLWSLVARVPLDFNIDPYRSQQLRPQKPGPLYPYRNLYRYPTKLPMGIKTRCFHWVSPALMEDSRMLFPKKSCTGTLVNMGDFPRGEQKKKTYSELNHKSNPFAKFAKWYFLFDWGWYAVMHGNLWFSELVSLGKDMPLKPCFGPPHTSLPFNEFRECYLGISIDTHRLQSRCNH